VSESATVHDCGIAGVAASVRLRASVKLTAMSERVLSVAPSESVSAFVVSSAAASARLAVSARSCVRPMPPVVMPGLAVSARLALSARNVWASFAIRSARLRPSVSALLSSFLSASASDPVSDSPLPASFA
jgi:hypothetical protein